MDDILICVPLRPSHPHIDLSTQQSIDALQWHGRLDVLHLGSVGGKNHYDDLADKLNWGKEVTLAGGYDAMLIVEADMLLPKTALLGLSGGDCDIAYGTYCSRRNGHPWLVFGALQGDAYTFLPVDELRAGGWVQTAGVGTGCTLIHASALEYLTFRGGEHSPDWALAQDAASEGMMQMHNLDVLCGHRIDALHVVYPDAAAPSMHRIVSHTQAWRLAGEYRVREGQHLGFSDGRAAHGGDIVSLPDDVAVSMFVSGTIEEI